MTPEYALQYWNTEKIFKFQISGSSSVQKFDIPEFPEVSRPTRSLLSFGQNAEPAKCKCQTQFEWTKSLKVNYFANAFPNKQALEAAKKRRA